MPRRKRRGAGPTIERPLDAAAVSPNASSSPPPLPSPPPPPPKRTRRDPTPPIAHVDAHVQRCHSPRVKHRNHPLSCVGDNFHSVSYPLGLMPYTSWHHLHHRQEPSVPKRPFVFPACHKHRSFPSAHRHKLFLVAERLSGEEGTVPTAERELNEELTWEVNFQLGIEASTQQDGDEVAGGKNSRLNQWFPFANEVDCSAALQLVARADCLSEKSYAVWSSMLDITYAPLPPEGKEQPEPQSAPSHPAAGQADVNAATDKRAAASQLPTPPSSSQPCAGASQTTQGPPPATATEYSSPPHLYRETPLVDTNREPPTPPAGPINRSLPEFYALLDAIERTSYVGAQYLEAYAELLHDDRCEDCWWSRNIAADSAPPS